MSLYRADKDQIRGFGEMGRKKKVMMNKEYCAEDFYFHCKDGGSLRVCDYKDGVSEGRFYQVLLYELDSIRKACASLKPNYQPPVTFIVVQKRHHTRLFANNQRDRSSTDRSGNILPGTVVDSKICHPTEFDFCLFGHAGSQGTSRPAYYHVLWDENNFTADGNNLCYTYARCTRSVSVVPPAYYAHLATFRTIFYMEPLIQNNGSSDGGATHGSKGTRTTGESGFLSTPCIEGECEEGYVLLLK